MSFSDDYLSETQTILRSLDVAAIERLVAVLMATREIGGRLFILGVGGSAANASHAVNDFRTLCGFDAYAPTDNVAELTARTNDNGWSSTFRDWLIVSGLSENDAVLVFSVGGGTVEASPNIMLAVRYAQLKGTSVLGIVSRDGGETAARADAYVLVPALYPRHITPHAEVCQAVIWHLVANHPSLRLPA